MTKPTREETREAFCWMPDDEADADRKWSLNELLGLLDAAGVFSDATEDGSEDDAAVGDAAHIEAITEATRKAGRWGGECVIEFVGRLAKDLAVQVKALAEERGNPSNGDPYDPGGFEWVVVLRGILDAGENTSLNDTARERMQEIKEANDKICEMEKAAGCILHPDPVLYIRELRESKVAMQKELININTATSEQGRRIGENVVEFIARRAEDSNSKVEAAADSVLRGINDAADEHGRRTGETVVEFVGRVAAELGVVEGNLEIAHASHQSVTDEACENVRSSIWNDLGAFIASHEAPRIKKGQVGQ